MFERIKRLFFRASPENPSTSLAKPATWLTSLFSPTSKSGAQVSEKSVIGITAVWRAFNLIAESLASMEWEVVRRKANNTTQIDYNHSLYYQLNTEPNENYSSFSFWFAFAFNALMHGNAYAHMVTNRRTAKIEKFVLLDPKHIKTWATAKGTLVHKDEQTGVVYQDYEIIHLPWVTADGITGMSTLHTLREAFGLALSSREFGNTFFANGAHLGGYIKFPGQLKSQESIERLKASWNTSYSGADKAGSTAILEGGAEYVQLGMKPADAGLLETQKFSIEDVSRITGVPPHLLAALDRATFNNIEHLSLEFAKYALRPWVIRIEKEFTRKAFSTSEKGRYFLRGDLTPFMVGDMNSQATMYSKMFTSGVLSPNDIRDKLGYNPIEGADELFVPVNMQPLTRALEAPATQPQGQQSTDANDDQQDNIDSETTRSYETQK